MKHFTEASSGSREDNEKAEERKDKVNKARLSREGETNLGIRRAVSLF
jgi:hypothetical protein